MPRYVVLRFEDNEEAERYIEDGYISTEAPPVVAMFAIPTLFCECPPVDPGKQGRIIARSSKYGWWVHRGCSKPVQFSYQSPKNLLAPVEQNVKPMWTFIATPERPHLAAKVVETS